MGQKIYATVSGDTWDLIAKKVYNNENLMYELMQANPRLNKIIIFDGGIDIICPVISSEKAGDLPPWAM